jgi:predicted nucleotidyltransferase component of viral defense system
MFYNILDEKRRKVLPYLKNFKEDFYLAGGTALALQIGHRDSIDFDFFSEKKVDTKKLFEKIRVVFVGQKVVKVQDELNTLTVLIDKSVKLSFFGYNYSLLEELINEPNLKLASVLDIASMKLIAITSRASNKDYIDLYYLLQDISLKDLLDKTSKKFPEVDRNLVLKSLVYFADIEIEPILFKNDKKIDFEQIKDFLKEEVFKLKI